MYIEGHKNKVADALSQYYDSSKDDDIHYDDLVSADIKIDKNGEDLPLNRSEEAKKLLCDTKRYTGFTTVSVSDSVELHQVEADTIDPPIKHIGRSKLLLTELLGLSNPLISDVALLSSIRLGYSSDKSWTEVLRTPEHFSQFCLSDSLILHMNDSGDSALVIPNIIHKGEGVRGIIIENAHKIIGHFGYQKTITYIHKLYWWSTMNKDTKKFCASCEACQTTKRCMMKQHGLLHQLPIPDRPWSGISMDFVGPFPESLRKNYLWVVMCHLTSQVHLVPVNMTTKTLELTHEFQFI